ncbi:hypothetical protein SH1V18_48160 [Vallitalea longa]|uniref:PcfJ-like protein n=1 Tax=Vallitalea longa TaxID=2936439 RepID=A0A9W5YGD6_9FIRM|nr:PcfJ domain-containing protein [Vallitalea longa]GKX32336.1 hypothetical protein SH1V18_48160 [Vallitalea longa]
MKKSKLSLKVEKIKFPKKYKYVIKGELITNKILQVTIYSCKNKKVLYRLFIDEKEYITYKYDSHKWSKAMLRNLESRDCNAITNYIVDTNIKANDSKKILGCQEEDLLISIYEYQKQLKIKAYIKKRRAIDDMFEQLKPLPEDLNEWVINKVFKDSNYIIYQKKGKKISGYCTRCKKKIKLDDVKHNKKIVCPNCQTEVTALSVGLWKRRNDVSNEKYFNIINNTSKGLVVRVFEAIKDETYQKQKLYITEVSRFLVNEKKMPQGYRWCDKQYCNGYYYWSYGTNWHERNDCLYHPSSYLYTDNLDEELIDKYKYCGLNNAKNIGTIDVIRYLYNYQTKPILEQFVKYELYNLVNDIILYQSRNKFFDSIDIDMNLKADTLKKVLGLNKQQMKTIKQANVDIYLLRLYKFSIKINQELDSKELRYLHIKGNGYYYSNFYPYGNIEKLTSAINEEGEIVRGYVTLKKLIMYKKKQKITNDNFYIDYLDYLEECKFLGYNMKSKSILYPKNLMKAHEETTKLIKIKEDEITKENLLKLHGAVAEIFQEEIKGYNFIFPRKISDFIKESEVLHHCVKSYVRSVASGKTFIIFMRDKSNKDKPLYTIEFNNNRIVQIRGYKNSNPTEEALNVAKKWLSNVNKKLNAA